MKIIYILIVLVVVALTLGCVGSKQNGASTKTPVAPVETSVAATPTPTIGEDLFGTEGDVAAIDSMLSDASLDTSLSVSI